MQFVTREGSNPKAHYSAGVVHAGTLYISGQLSIDPATGGVAPGGVRAETRQALHNLDLVLQNAGCSRSDVLQCRVYTPDVSLWDEINSEYAAFFGDHKPARCVVPTTPLHFGCLVEIEAVAAVPQK